MEKKNTVGESAACLTCGQMFDLRAPHQIYCSKACRLRADEIKRLRAAAPEATKECECCGGPFETRRPRQKYCSSKCRLTAQKTAGLLRNNSACPTSVTGAISELMAARYLMNQGFVVARNLAPVGVFDLVVWKPRELYLVDVKSGPTKKMTKDQQISYLWVSGDGAVTWLRKTNISAGTSVAL